MADTERNDYLSELRTKVVAKGHASGTPCYVESGKGAVLTDVDGREFIDFAGGIAVMNVGHSHPKVVAAIKDQAEKLTHTCFMVTPYEPAVKLCEKLCQITPGDFPKAALLLNSGAEAVENAVKIARYYTKRTGIICFEHAFHGRTLLTMTLTSKVKPYKFGFGPFAPEVYRMPYAYCYRCPFNLEYPSCNIACADYLKEFFVSHSAPETTAAVIVEPVIGEGGFIVPPPEYFPKLAKICKDNGILFIADEIQSGTGRTGKMFAIEHWNVEPDLMTVAKSIAAGMPLSAVVGKQEVMNSVHPFGVGGTYGGNPVSCRAALAVVEIFEEEDMLGKAETLGKKLRKRFNSWKSQYEIIGEVRGLGAMMALELVKDRETKEPAAEEAKALTSFCFERGLVLLSCGTFGNVIRVLMPLVITDEQLEKGLGIMEEGLASLTK
ncbi:MAG: 4-aminobutyrate--2-oxoglutarate transaminase [Deltaproteobacteria bacterium]|nr:4-aminobutyrate--2-oxoglutarate transaminase [Deltaproteobacteria bacterium]MBW2082268.1 4-aminobutyrate--2-oxoglutarate transaminase [Deltaproteobacteria bacterium]